MVSKKTIISRVLLLVLIILFCLALSGVVWALTSFPDFALHEFGPANPALSPSQRMVYAFRLFWNRDLLLKPVDPLGDQQEFKIELGETIGSIAERLEEEDLIPSANVFKLYLVYAGLDTTTQAGTYQLSPAMDSMTLAHALQDATPQEVEFIVLPGWRLEEVAASLPTSGLQITQDEFIATAYRPELLANPAGLPLEGSVEGFLLPGSYRIPRDSSAKEMLNLTIAGFGEQVSQGMKIGFERQGLDLRGAVILASIVQREAVIEEEQPVIASVFLNRIAAGMKLDSDPTVQYAHGFIGDQGTWWKNPLSAEDLKILSPYNTYTSPGLPPGPICNPSLSALNAVAYPAETPYYYFRARCDDSSRHAFAVTYEEQLNNACP